jgi:hypothetical protein
MKNMFRILFIVLSVSITFSCGNEAKVVPPSQSNVGYVDTSPGSELLSVQAIYPEDNATSVSANAKIVIVFSKAVNTASVTANTNITIDNGMTFNAINPAVDFTAGDTILTLTPSSGLVNGTLYNVNITAGITAVDGTAITINASCHSDFTVIADNSALFAPRVLAATRYPIDPPPPYVSKNIEYVEVTFSEDMDNTTITTASFTVTGTIGGVSSTSVTAINTRTYRLNLNPATVDYSEVVTASLDYTLIKSSVASGGLNLVDNVINTWNFTIEAAPTGLPAAAIPSVWLTSITTTSAYVNWVTSRPVASSTVDYGLTTGYELPVENEPATPVNTVHRILLSGLSVSTRYYFIITSDGVTRTGYFMTNHSGGATNGTLLSDPLGNETLLHSVKSTTAAGVLNGSSYIILKNGNYVIAKYITSAVAASWAANGETVDSGHNWTGVRSFSDSRANSCYWC